MEALPARNLMEALNSVATLPNDTPEEILCLINIISRSMPPGRAAHEVATLTEKAYNILRGE